MPRQARLDAFRPSSGIFDSALRPESSTGTLHHVMVRGLERWALLPNHAHRFARTGTRPLARAMRSLLRGYAGASSRRHTRGGHLFQHRDKSIVA